MLTNPYTNCFSHYEYTGLMITASHQTFSDQIKHLFGQIEFAQTNLLYIINGEVIKLAKDNKCPDNFLFPYHKHWYKPCSTKSTCITDSILYRNTEEGFRHLQ